MRRLWTGLLCVILCVAMTGCQLWMDGSYASVTPNKGDESTEVHPAKDLSSSSELIRILSDAVENATPSVTVFTTKMSDVQLRGCISQAVRYITNTHPIGCYGVREITYDIGTNAGRQAAAIHITYLHNRSELLRMKEAENMEEGIGLIHEALGNCDAGLTVRVRGYRDMDFVQMVQNYADEHPQLCMELPQVSVSTYPDQGTDRVVEIKFSYKNSREVLRSMQQTVQPAFEAAVELAASAQSPQAQLKAVYDFIALRHTYTEDTSITPSYSLLRNGVGDSKAFATVYAAMCRETGLDCRVVTGTRSGKARCWNVVVLEDDFYYVDVLQCIYNGKFTLKPFENMTGYVWDYSAYGEEQAPVGPEESTNAATEP